MRFSDEEIAIARRLRSLGLSWTPTAGHYVLDETDFCKQPSPFQDGVYFILNYDYFMKAVGGVDRFREIMTWMPTWYDCRQILAANGVSTATIAQSLADAAAIQSGEERLCLYRLIEETIKKPL